MVDGPSTCVFSEDRKYRYSLQHFMDRRGYVEQYSRIVNFIMLNPSTADEHRLDPTLRRCKGFAKLWGCTSFVVTNLFAFRATDPNNMKRAADPVGPENNKHILRIASNVDIVVLGWGAHGAYLGRSREVKRMMQGQLTKLTHIHHLGLTGLAEPRHPLYIPGDAQLVMAFP